MCLSFFLSEGQVRSKVSSDTSQSADGDNGTGVVDQELLVTTPKFNSKRSDMTYLVLRSQLLARKALKIPLQCFFSSSSVHASTIPQQSPTEFKLPLFRAALDQKFKDKVGFTDTNGNLTYSQLGSKSIQLAQQLRDIVGNQESQIAFLCPHNSSFLITLWACWMSNNVAVPLSDKHPENLLEYFAKLTEAKVIVTTKEYADQMRKLTTSVNTKLHVVDFDTLSGSQPAKLPGRAFGTSDNALVLFTSGTTGLPKGVLLTHQNLMAQITNICQAWEITSKDTMLHVLPLHHTHGLVHALISPLFVGGRCHMLEKFNAAQAWKDLLSPELERPNVLMGVPTVYSKLIEEHDKTYGQAGPSTAEFIRETCINKMRLMISGSASLPIPVLERWEEITGHRLLERYGMTEIGMALTNPLHGERKPGYVGSAFESVRLRVADIVKDQVTVLAEGGAKNVEIFSGEKTVVGDLLIKGPSVFKEYLKNPEATAKEFTKDGWFITGDTVECSDGIFKILGRKSVDIIKSGGYKLSALEIETQLLSLAEVQDVSVVGLPDPTWGQKVAAMIVWSGKELSLNELREVAKKRLPSYACPSRIQTIEKLPRNQLGKVNKKDLVKLFT